MDEVLSINLNIVSTKNATSGQILKFVFNLLLLRMVKENNQTSFSFREDLLENK